MASEGIFRKVKLLLDKVSASKMEADAQAALKKGTDPSAAKQNLSQIDSALNGLKAGALKLGAVLAGAFAVHKLIAFGEESVRQAAAAQAGWAQLGNTVKNAGGNVDRELPKLKRLADEFQRSTRFDDDAFVQGMTRSIQITGSQAESLKLVSLASDVAVTKQIAFADAMEMVSRIQQGQTRGLKEFGITTNDAAAGLEELSRRLRGATATDLESFGGKIEQVKNQWDDLKKSFGQELLGGNSVSGLEKVRSTIESVTPVAVSLAGILRDSVLLLLKSAEGWREIFAHAAAFVRYGGPHGNEHLAEDARAQLRASDMAAEQAREDRRRALEALMFPARTKTPPPPSGGAPRDRGPSIPRSSPRVPGITGGIVGTTGLQSGFASIAAEAKAGLGAAQEEVDQFTKHSIDAFHDMNTNIENSMMSAAFNVQNAWEDTFAILFDNFRAVGPAAETLARGVAASLIGAVGQFASVKAAEEMALAFGETASGFGALALGPFGVIKAALHGSSARGHLLAAGAWATLAGAAGAASHAVGSGGGSVPSGGGTDQASRMAAQTSKSGPDIHIHLDPINSKNVEHQRELGETIRHYQRRFGGRIVLD